MSQVWYSVSLWATQLTANGIVTSYDGWVPRKTTLISWGMNSIDTTFFQQWFAAIFYNAKCAVWPSNSTYRQDFSWIFLPILNRENHLNTHLLGVTNGLINDSPYVCIYLCVCCKFIHLLKGVGLKYKQWPDDWCHWYCILKKKKQRKIV